MPARAIVTERIVGQHHARMPGQDPHEALNRTREALHDSEGHFRLLVESVRDYAIIMLGPTGHVLTWNLGAQRIKGYEADEIIGKHLSIFYPPEEAQRGTCDDLLAIAAKEGRVE